MANPLDGHGSSGFLTEADEMSLASAREQLTADSQPDTLEVRDDSVLVMQDQFASWRRPALIALAVAGIAAVAWIGGAVLSRRGSIQG